MSVKKSTKAEPSITLEIERVSMDDAIALGLGKFADIDFCEPDYSTDDWANSVFTPDDATDQVIDRVCSLYCFMRPDKTPDDFLTQVFMPIAERKDIEADEVFKSEQTSYKVFFNFLWATCFYAAKAQRCIDADEPDNAWIALAKANYKLGVLEGLILVDPALRAAYSERAAHSAKTRAEKRFGALKAHAIELAKEHLEGTKAEAARKIKDAIVELSKSEKFKVNLSPDNAEKLLSQWLTGLPFGGKRKPRSKNVKS